MKNLTGKIRDRNTKETNKAAEAKRDVPANAAATVKGKWAGRLRNVRLNSPQEQKQTQETPKSTPETKAVEASSKAGIFSKFPKRKYIYLVFALVLIGGLFVFLGQQDRSADNAETPLFTIDTREFYMSDIQDHIDTAGDLGIAEDDAIEGIKQAYTFIVLAEKYNIEVLDSEVKQVLLDFSGFEADEIDLANDWFNLIGRRAAIEQKVGKELNRATKGHSFVFYFGTLVDTFVNPDDASLESIGIDESWLGDEERIASDRQYARERAEYYRDRLINGDIDSEAAVNEVINDERLHHYYRINEELQGSGRFGDEGTGLLEQVPGSVIQEIRDFSGDIGYPTDIKAGEVRYAGSTDAESPTFEAYYYFILVSDRDERWYEFESQLQEYGLEIYL